MKSEFNVNLYVNCCTDTSFLCIRMEVFPLQGTPTAEISNMLTRWYLAISLCVNYRISPKGVLLEGLSAFQCLDRADLSTALTQDTLCCVLPMTGVVTNLYIHRTYFKALATANTLALITSDAYS